MHTFVSAATVRWLVVQFRNGLNVLSRRRAAEDEWPFQVRMGQQGRPTVAAASRSTLLMLEVAVNPRSDAIDDYRTMYLAFRRLRWPRLRWLLRRLDACFGVGGIDPTSPEVTLLNKLQLSRL
jgi:hypothetical protein